jgi:hypothetical protein
MGLRSCTSSVTRDVAYGLVVIGYRRFYSNQQNYGRRWEKLTLPWER